MRGGSPISLEVNSLDTANELIDFISQSPSPAHVVDTSEMRLMKSGFEKLFMDKQWKLRAGGKYFVSVYGTALLAFTIGNERGQLRMAAAHTDFPCFRLKPSAGITKD